MFSEEHYSVEINKTKNIFLNTEKKTRVCEPIITIVNKKKNNTRRDTIRLVRYGEV